MNNLYNKSRNIKVILETEYVPLESAYYSVVKNTDNGYTFVFQVALDCNGNYCYLLCFRSDIIALEYNLSSGMAMNMVNFWLHGSHKNIATYDGTIVYLAMPREADGNPCSRIAMFNNNGLLRRLKLNLYNDVHDFQLCQDVLNTFNHFSHSRKLYLRSLMKDGVVLKFVFVDLEDRQIWWNYDKTKITRSKHLVFQYGFNPASSEYVTIAETSPKYLKPLLTGMLYFSTLCNYKKPVLIKFDHITDMISDRYLDLKNWKYENGGQKVSKSYAKKMWRKNRQILGY